MNSLHAKFKMLLDMTDTSYVREFHDSLSWNARLTAILGASGVGKSTLLLQHIKLYEDLKTSLYVSADDIWFSAHSLYELADSFYNDGGKSLYIDEIHTYENWSQEIKNIYDSFPTLRVMYSGSSILDLMKGGYDLSRRLVSHKMPGLSFREFIALSKGVDIQKHTLERILSNDIDFPRTELHPVALFKEYCRAGYYPYFMEGDYYLRLDNVIKRVIERDIPRFVGMSVATSEKLKTLLYIIAQSVPFKPNYSKIGKDLDLHRTSVANLFVWLEKAGLINILRDATSGISLLGKVNKVYLNDPNLSHALSDTEPDIGNIRETIFLSWLRGAKYDVTASPVSDFKVGKYTFEVGGKNKGKHQIANTPDSFIVKDDIEYGYSNIIPLWAFGLLY